MTAVPNTGWHFVDWSDGVLTAARTDLDVTANIAVTANFAIDTYTLAVTSDHGTIVKAPGPAGLRLRHFRHDHGHAGRRVHLHRLDGIRDKLRQSACPDDGRG